MPTLTINGKEVTVPQGTNLIAAAEAAGFQVPYFCFHPGLSAPANCRMCLVDVEGARKLDPACYTPVRDGMIVHTESEKVVTARRSVLEFILVNHPIDCPICDQAGECWLQDHYLKYDAKPSRVRTEKVSKVKVHPIGPEVVYDGERCILCTRCVRFCEEITGTSELTVVERGDISEIRTFPGMKLENDYSMCTADLCPVGALTTRDFRFERRVWLLDSTPSICTGCARNCSVHMDHFQDEVERYVPRENLEVNEYWMCDAGRLSYKMLHTDRLVDIAADGEVIPHWGQAIGPIAQRIAGDPEQERTWGMVLSPQSSTEGLAAGVAFAAQCLGGARLFAGGKRSGDWDDLLIRADKNPNSAGLKLVAGDDVGEIAALIELIEKGEINAVYMMGAHIPVDEAMQQRFDNALQRLDLFVLQSIWKDRFHKRAQIALPAASHAEHKGTWINCDGVVQTVDQAIEPEGNSAPDWQIFLRLSRGMRKPLPFDDWAGAAKLTGIDEGKLVAPGPTERRELRSPHGPQRAIPRREATPLADGNRSPFM